MPHLQARKTEADPGLRHCPGADLVGWLIEAPAIGQER